LRLCSRRLRMVWSWGRQVWAGSGTLAGVAVERTTGVRAGEYLVEALAVRSAVDFAVLYEAEARAEVRFCRGPCRHRRAGR